ncbi:MAG: glycosyltransferase family 2 protein [Elusimicrobiota bacterium]
MNRGYGRALVSGIETATHDWVLIIDGDGSYPPEEAERLLGACAGFDMVVGARQGKLFWGNPLQALRRWVYLSLAQFVAGEPIPDANSGLRLFKKSACLLSMPFWCFGYSFTTTMTLSFVRSGRFVSFVPVRFAARRGFSKVRPVRDILRTLQIMTQVILYFNPLKLAAAVSLAAVLLAGAAFVFFLYFGRLGLAVHSCLVILGLAVIVFLFGCVLDSMRMHGAHDQKRSS